MTSKFFFVGEVFDSLSYVFPTDVYDISKHWRDLFFEVSETNASIYDWYVWIKPTSLKYPFFDGIEDHAVCLSINLGVFDQDDNKRIEDKWIPLELGSEEDYDLIYGKEIARQNPPPEDRPNLPANAANENGEYEFRYIVSLEHI